MRLSCPACGERISRGERACSECGRSVVFQSYHSTTDQEWCQLIEELSADETMYFTTNQLFIHWQRKRAKRYEAALAQAVIAIGLIVLGSSTDLPKIWLFTSMLAFISALPVVGRVYAIILFSSWLVTVVRWGLLLSLVTLPWWIVVREATLPPLLLCAIALIDAIRRRRLLSKRTFMEQLQRWKRFHKLPQLLIRPSLHRPHPELQGPSLYDYHVDQILVVDQDLTVDLLTRNGFLTDHPCILISLNGYPEYSVQFSRRLLTLKEDVNVYLLHRDGHDAKEILKQLRSVGCKRHRLVHLGWGGRSRPQLIKHLGFRPYEWDAFAIDSLPPESLSEGIPIAMDEEIPLVDLLGPRLRMLS